MKKLSNISESVWGDIRRRGLGDDIKEEDAFNPEYIDFGENTTVVWAKEALEINGEVEFYFKEVKDYNNNGWRLPTKEEVEQINFHRDNVRIYWAEGYETLKFPEGELRIHTDISGRGFRMWTSTLEEKWDNYAYSYGYDNSYHFEIRGSGTSMNTMYAFLVKDKKILKR